MKYNPAIHHRRSIRLKGYDYSQAGLYFVTICVQNRECIFGEIVDNEMILNENGQIVQMVWNELPQHYNHIELGEFVVMPNHIHGIVIITDVDVATVGAGLKPAPTTPKHGLPEIIRALKTFSARKINDLVRAGLKPAPTRGEKLWQRNYWEHIIRDEQSHQRIADYIVNNPINWEKDKFYTE